ncbi:MAG: imidazole glycerol phosphate synthase subunit HisH [Elusimicrobia bacterium]|nr:imidazole glycerol phosphate synthase subunit HisH [Elusimicrobiota bacterium]
MIAVVDYGMGNLASVRKALETVGAHVMVTAKPRVIQRARGLVVPGVGAFGMAMQRLKRLGLIRILQDWVAKNRPYLGICLGLQILFETSEEAPGVSGLGSLLGRVVRFPNRRGFKVPHMGWNTIERTGQAKEAVSHSLLKGLGKGPYVYFVHSYYPIPRDPGVVATTTRYGLSFCSAVSRGRLFASQFHPEKSGRSGLALLRQFVQRVSC